MSKLTDKSHILVEVAIQYTTEYKETIFSFANNIQTGDGGHMNKVSVLRSVVYLTIMRKKQKFIKMKTTVLLMKTSLKE